MFGVKLNAPTKEDDRLIRELKKLPIIQRKASLDSNFTVWEHIFPSGKHIFLTRRNKIRQAVSWWKAIMTDEWHRKSVDQSSTDHRDLLEKYNFEALKHLLLEISVRESAIQAFLKEGGSSALTIVYEDFINDYTGTVRRIGSYVGVAIHEGMVGPPHYAKLADEVSDEWTERFRIELQKDWANKVW